MKISRIAAAAVFIPLAGCGTTATHFVDAKTGTKIDSYSVTQLASPAQTITYVKRPGHHEQYFANADRSLLGIIVPAAIGGASAAGIIAATARCTYGCGPIYNVSQSGSRSAANATANAKSH